MGVPPIQILLIDDHPVVRRGLSELICCEIECCCSEASNAEECLAIVQRQKIDVAVLDISLGEKDGLELIDKLNSHEIKTVVYSMFEDPETIRRALFEGALSYVSKRDAADELLLGIRSAIDSRIFLSPIAAAAMEHRIGGIGAPLDDVLSLREVQTLDMLGKGCSKHEIAEKLSISVRTAETYFQRIIEKLGLSNTKDLRKFAIEHRLQHVRS